MIGRIKKEVKKRLALGFLVVEKTDNPVVIAYRKGRCGPCENYSGPESDECKFCTCVIDAKARSITHRDIRTGKIRLTTCPMGRWNDKDEANYYRELDGLTLIE